MKQYMFSADDFCYSVFTNIVYSGVHELNDDVYAWLNENITNEWIFLAYIRQLVFYYEEDAMAFKLKFT